MFRRKKKVIRYYTIFEIKISKKRLRFFYLTLGHQLYLSLKGKYNCLA